MSTYVREIAIRGIIVCDECSKQEEFMVDYNKNNKDIYLDEINEYITDELSKEEYNYKTIEWLLEDTYSECPNCIIQEYIEADKDNKATTLQDNENRL